MFWFLIELSTAEFSRKLDFFNLQKKFTETTDLANACADLFMQSLATTVFRPLAPIQTETELTQMSYSPPSYLPVTQDTVSVSY